MPVYEITSPDGRTFEVTAPDGATQDQILAYAQQNYKQPAAPQPMEASPTQGVAENLAAGAGKAIADAGRGVVQRSAEMLSNAPASLPFLQMANLALDKLGLSPRQEVVASKDAVRESRRLDAPLMGTTSGQVGNILGNVAMLAPTAAIGGANTIPGAAAIGGVAGLLQPTVSGRETAMNTGLGVAGGAIGQAIANKIPPMLRRRVDAAAATQTANAPRFDTARRAAKEGYVVPPADLEPGMLSETVSGLSGKIKTAQVASQRNQEVTNNLVRRALNLPKEAPLNPQTLASIRSAAGESYEAVANVGTVTPGKAYSEALDKAVEPFLAQSKSFPNRKMPQVVDDIMAYKTDAFDARAAVEAIKVLRDDAASAYAASNKTVGKAYKKAAEALEQALDDHLVATNAPGELLNSYRTARQTIAKTYTVEGALNPVTGAVDASKLSAALKKGKPLSGELRQVGEFATAFPKATQALKEAPKAVSPLDFAVGGFGLGQGSGVPMALMAARPVARSLLLSGPVQSRALQQTTPVPFTQATQRLLEKRLTQGLLGPIGGAGGIYLAQ